MQHEMIAWLRKVIEDDLRCARMISDNGFEPQRWDTEPPGQVNPAVLGNSGRISGLLPGSKMTELPDYPAWVQLVAYSRLNTEPEDEDSREDVFPVVLSRDGRREWEHIIRHDPRNTVADCQAKLEILDTHCAELADYRDGDGIERVSRDCITCGPGGAPDSYPCWTLRVLAMGYQYRDGWEPEWGDPD